MKSPEIKLLVACARRELTPEIQTLITEYVGKINDWKNVIYLANFHRITPLLYTSLKKACPDLVPCEILKQLKKSYTNNAAWNLTTSTKLLKILDLLKKNHIPAIPFKGPTIAEKAYKDLNLRSFSDLDILIKKKDVISAQKLLIQYGYRAEITLPAKNEKKYLDCENSLTFYDKNNLEIDLHWEITGRYLLKHIYFESFEDRLQTTLFFGKKILSIPDDIMLVYLCSHGMSHCWDRFEWLCCFVELLKIQDEKILFKTLKLAEKMGAKRIFLFGLYLGQNLLGIQYPEKINAAVHSDRDIMNWADKIKRGIFNQKHYDDGSAGWRFSPVHIFIRDSYSDRLRYVFYLFTMPTIKEWIKYPLPLWLTPLYRIIRPIRLLTVYFFRNKNA